MTQHLPGSVDNYYMAYDVVIITLAPRGKVPVEVTSQIRTSNGKPLPPKILRVGHNRQELQKFVEMTKSPQGMRWAKVFFGSHHQITRVQALPNPIELSAALLRDPPRVIQEIRDHIDEHISRLPPAWTLAKVGTREIATAFGQSIGLAVAVERGLGPRTADQLLSYQGVKGAQIYYATVILLKANDILQSGTPSEFKLALPLAVQCGAVFPQLLELATSNYANYRGAHQVMTLLLALTNMLRANNGDLPLEIPLYGDAQ